MTKVVVDNKKNSANSSSPIINEDIKAPKVRLIGPGGEMMGIVPAEEALLVAKKAGLDLVLVAEESDPPVCKILDYGRHKYHLQKKKAESRKKQKTVNVKEVQLRPFIGENDLQVKCKAIKKFIESGHKVKIFLRYRGRELTRQEAGREIIKKVQEFSREFAKEEMPPKLEGPVITMVLSGK